jgi:hypothetical protein
MRPIRGERLDHRYAMQVAESSVGASMN